MPVRLLHGAKRNIRPICYVHTRTFIVPYATYMPVRLLHGTKGYVHVRTFIARNAENLVFQIPRSEKDRTKDEQKAYGGIVSRGALEAREKNISCSDEPLGRCNLCGSSRQSFLNLSSKL